jgi:(S)-sulfolactate dehydrogenase
VVDAALMLLRGAYSSDPRGGGGHLAAADAFPRDARRPGKVLGVVGFGSIGRLTARKAAAIGMRVFGYDAMVTRRLRAAWAGVAGTERRGLDELLRGKPKSCRCTCRSRPRRAACYGRDPRLGLLQARRPCLLNTGHAAGTSTRPLARRTCCARAGWGARAPRTCRQQRPLTAGSPLVGAPRLLLTPHIAGVPLEAQRAQ